MDRKRTYIAIDLKSFYASVECAERKLNPLATNLVVADASRTEKTICLAVSPSLKEYGIPGRARLFEVLEKMREVNAERQKAAPGGVLKGESCFADELMWNPEMAAGFITAPPRMSLYIDYSTRIYQVYLRYIAPEDIHVYSIDEVFMDVTGYLRTYGMTAHELALKMVRDVLRETGITATAGIGSNLYLCKIAMDIEAKHAEPDEDGVRIAELDEMTYRRKLWDLRPITRFWRVGRGIAAKLEAHGIYTMGDVARCSVENEELLYRLFGVNAELLIDHAWGWEPCTIDLIKAYKPENNSICSGQVLACPYDFAKARVIVQEMADALALDLVSKRLAADQVVLTVNYDAESLKKPEILKKYKDKLRKDYYGRTVPEYAHGSANLERFTSASSLIINAVTGLYDRLVDPDLTVRRITIGLNHVVAEEKAAEVAGKDSYEQLDLFTDYAALEKKRKAEEATLLRERKMQEAMLSIKEKFGKNAVLKGINFEEGATGRDRNRQIGGHRE